ncbi:polymer-forming cytoskeletal protein [Paenibacillus sp. FJAT-26967]|uniref:bactofilin family protein n=1 Tax=Paenibacillus sp. FJAT-26967 TaxID=1729690 RepID=UPI000838236A|nr:polymer-forming cytoskeletal protein [Paenibacillus sp. FJAT-26967]
MVFEKKRQADLKTTDTVIGESSICEGKFVTEASLRIEGQLIGDIECAGDIVIGEHAVVHSNIQAREVTIAGKVKGNVTTKGKLTVMSTGELIGNIQVLSFIVQEGGIFQGSSHMRTAAGTVEEMDKNVSKINGTSSGKSRKEEQPLASAN